MATGIHNGNGSGTTVTNARARKDVVPLQPLMRHSADFSPYTLVRRAKRKTGGCGMIWGVSVWGLSNWKDISSHLKICKTMEREKQSQACKLASAGCCGLHGSVQPHRGQSPPVTLHTYISGMVQKEGFWALTPTGRHTAWAAGGQSQVHSQHNQWPWGSHCPNHDHHVPPPSSRDWTSPPLACTSGAGGVT